MSEAPPRLSRPSAAALVVAALALGGVLVGALWSWLAPAADGVVALTRDGERKHAYLGNEADHFFVAAFLMLGLLCVLAVVAATVVWQWQAHRGPVMAAALTVGMIGAAGAATAVGGAAVRLRYGTLDIDAAAVSPQHRLAYVTEAPAVFFGTAPLQAAATLLLPAAAAALAYAVATAAALRDDLGGYPPQEPSLPSPSPQPATVTAAGGAPSDGSAPGR